MCVLEKILQDMERQLEEIFKRKEGRPNWEEYLHKDADVGIVMEAMFAIREELKEQEDAVKRWRQFWQQEAESHCTEFLKCIYEMEKKVRIRWKRHKWMEEEKQEQQKEPEQEQKQEDDQQSEPSNE